MTWTTDHANLTHRILGVMAEDLAAPATEPLPRARARDPRGVRMAIEQTIAALLTNRRGGTLYIPHVEGDELWIDVSADSLRIPREIEVALAPGVVLVPVRSEGSGGVEHRLEIAGVLRAPLGTIFATQGWFDRHRDPASAGQRVADVGLTSRRMERVHPEWWGASDPGDGARESDNDALEAALRAATVGRWSDDGGARHRLPTLPIELRGSYALSRPLTLGDPTGLQVGIELRGAPGGADAVTLRCGPRFPRNQAMIEVAASAASVTLEDLRIDGGTHALSCLAITDAGGAATSRKHLVRRCAFDGARASQISFYDTRVERAPSTDPSAPPPLGRATESLRVEHCRFRLRFSEIASPIALWLTAPPDVTVDVRGSTFVGEAPAMVHARSCGLSLANCHFRNELAPLRLLSTAPDSDLHRDGPEGGVNVFLDGVPTWPVGTLYAQDCRSNSIQFLATRRAAEVQGDCTIIGLQHVRSSVVWTPGSVKRVPPEPPLERKPPFWDVFVSDPVLPDDVARKVLDGTLQAKVASPVIARLPKQQRFDRDKLDALEDFPIAYGPGGDSEGLHGQRFVAPIHWHLRGKLTLMGCRFAAPATNTTPFVEGFAGCGDIVDLGIVARNDSPIPVRVASVARHVTVGAVLVRAM